MAVINTNVKALFSQAALSSTQRAQTVAMQQLSTGKRINTSRDDAAGMAIATRMTHQIRSMNQAIRNANDALSMIQTAESATTTINDMLTRMRELAIQATNDSNSNDQRSYLDLEFQQLKKEIVSVSEKVEWNGFPLLNGKAGTPVGEMPVLKVTSDGLYDDTLSHSVSEAKTTSGATISTTGTGVLAKSGTLSIVVDASKELTSAKLTLEDGTVMDLTDYAEIVDDSNSDPTIIRFTSSPITDNSGTFDITASADYDDETVTVKVGRDFAQLSSMRTGDLIINGEAVPSSTAVDTVSPANGDMRNNLASSIARAAAINEVAGRTGVTAVVQKNVMTGAAMDPAINSQVQGRGTVTINGYITGEIVTTKNNVRASRDEAVRQINKISHLTGVVAVDTGVDSQGITLTAADGRNIEVAFNTSNTAAQFSTLTGLKQGVNVGSYALESKVEQRVDIASAPAGDISVSGLRVGDYTRNISREITSDRAAAYAPIAKVVEVGGIAASNQMTLNGINVSGADAAALATDINTKLDGTLTAVVHPTNGKVYITADQPGVDFTYVTKTATLEVQTVVENTVGTNRALRPGDLVINGVAIPGSLDTSDILTNEAARSSDNGGSAIAIAASINSKSAETGVKATANGAVMTATSAIENKLPQSGFYSVYVNGTQVVVQLNPDDSPGVRMNRIIAELKKHEGQTGVEGVINDKTGGIDLRTVDGRNLSVWFDPTQKASDGTDQVIRASMFGIGTGSPSDKPQTTRISLPTGTSVDGTISIKINNTTINANVAAGDDEDEVATALYNAIQTAIDSTDSNLYGLQLSDFNAGDGYIELTNASAADDNWFQQPFEVSILATPESEFEWGVKSQAVAADDWDTSNDAVFINPVASDVLAVEDADDLAAAGTPVNAKTIYGSVTLTSDKAYTLAPGANGLGADSSFTALGFVAGTFGGASSVEMSPPRVGRMTFQVGPSVGNDISFDLADFGKNGPITQLITWDVDLPNLAPGESIPTPGQDNPIFNGVKLTRSFIGSKDGALEVLAKLDATMDKVNAQRATMGSIMNRLDQVVTNLTNVSMNMSASRSQIEDADYAAASTELAKTQIMQQAATAVLAQANTSQQSVLKLLGG
jgi:flagellin